MPAADALPTAVRTSSFSSRDEEEVTEFIRQAYVGNRSRFAPDRDRVASFEAVTAVMPGVAGSEVRSSIDYSAATDPFDFHLFFVVRRGRLRVRNGADETLLPRGEVTFHPLDVELVDIDVQALQLPTARLDQVARDIAGIPAGALRFDAGTPVSHAMRVYWRSVVALHAFPNTSMTRQHAAGPGRVGPAALRRAVAYIDANSRRPVALSEIAAAGRHGGPRAAVRVPAPPRHHPAGLPPPGAAGARAPGAAGRRPDPGRHRRRDRRSLGVRESRPLRHRLPRDVRRAAP